MTEKLKEYQVIDVFCGGTFYKVRHKVTNKIFAWKAYNCSAHGDQQIQNVIDEVKTISQVPSDNLLRYYDTILHAPTKTLYLVVEYVPWRSLHDLLEECADGARLLGEGFLWRLLHELARACKAVRDLRVQTLTKCISSASVFVSDSGELRVNCFEWGARETDAGDLMQQVGELAHKLCYKRDELAEFQYSDDLQDVVEFLAEQRSVPLGPDVLLYHPTVLTNMESHAEPECMSDILVPQYSVLTSQMNKCDSEKADELCKAVQPLPRTIFNVGDSPIYRNLSPKRNLNSEIFDTNLSRDCLSPTLAALALELPGYVPRSRKPYSEAMEVYGRPKLVSEETFSEEWMSRLAALRRREESLNRRERDIIAKEIVSSPTAKVIPLDECEDLTEGNSNGITLPPMIEPIPGKREWVSRRRHRRSGSVRARRKSYGYEELDSSLSADAGDGSIIITAAKFTEDNLPRRTIFPEVSTKKVHFRAANPFIESDESVTLTFYELDNMDRDGYQVPRRLQKDIKNFKYLDLEKVTSEKRSAMNWSHSSPSKQAKVSKSVFGDISNQSSIRKTPSKSSLTSNSSRFSMTSARSHWSVESKVNESVGYEATGRRTRAGAGARPSLAPLTPVAPPDVKKKTRKSLIPFKTPFKFMSKS